MDDVIHVRGRVAKGPLELLPVLLADPPLPPSVPSNHLLVLHHHIDNTPDDGKSPSRLRTDQRPFQHMHVKQRLVQCLQELLILCQGLSK